MRLIGELEDSKQATKFSAYLITVGIPAKAEPTEAGASEIWVHEEDQLSTAQAELAAFKSSPEDPKYSAAVAQASKISREDERKRRAIQKKISVGTQTLKPKTRLTVGLIVFSVIVALVTDFGANYNSPVFRALQFVSVPAPKSMEILKRNDGNYDSLDVRLASIQRGEIWRLVTQMFIHLSPVHLLFNMMWLFQLGSLIERRYGWQRMLILVLLTAALSGFAQGVVPERFDGSQPGMTEDFTLLSAGGGMSGVVYGLLGFVWIKTTHDRSSGFRLPQSTVTFMLGWLVFCMIPGLTENLLGISVANWAHGIGLVAGMAMGYLRWK